MKKPLKKLPSCSLYDIKIPYKFQLSPPKPEKLIHKVLVFSRESELEPIIVDSKMNLLDGYCSYLIAQQTCAEFAKIIQITTECGCTCEMLEDGWATK